MRKKDMQARYDEWMTGIKVKYGSTGESNLSFAVPHTLHPGKLWRGIYG